MPERKPKPARAKPARPQPRRDATPQVRDEERAAVLLRARAPLPVAPHDDLSRRPFKLASLNCCGVRSAERRGLLKWLAKSRPDVLCLQEVRAWPDQVPAEIRCPAGYNSRWLVAGKKGYSGVATYSRPAPDRHAHGTGLTWSDERTTPV